MHSFDGLLWSMKSSPVSYSQVPVQGFGNIVGFVNNLYLYAASAGLFMSNDGLSWRGPISSTMPGTATSPCNVSFGSDKIFVTYGVTSTTTLTYTDSSAQDLLYVP